LAHVMRAQHFTNDGEIVLVIRGIHILACLADATQRSFVPLYKDVMTCLTKCIQLQVGNGNVGVSSENMSALIGAALEAMAIVSKAVTSCAEEDVEVYKADARNIMTMILPLLQAYATSSSASQSAMVPLEQALTSSARIASLLEEEFAEFAPAVLSFLLQWASQEVDVSVTVSLLSSFALDV